MLKAREDACVMTLQEVADRINREEGTSLTRQDIWWIQERALRKIRYQLALLALTPEEAARCAELPLSERSPVFKKILIRLIGNDGTERLIDRSEVRRILDPVLRRNRSLEELFFSEAPDEAIEALEEGAFAWPSEREAEQGNCFAETENKQADQEAAPEEAAEAILVAA